jgi:lysophospholipid acyltransferase (LPLAT)-like uncharacterized protein
LPGHDEIRRKTIAARPVHGPARRLWIRVRTGLKRQSWYGSALVWLAYGYMRLVGATNRLIKGVDRLEDAKAEYGAFIVALWHGQHIMAPLLVPRGFPMVALLSRSADAEINARVVEKFGIETVRGSGGRDGRHDTQKGGARALISLKRALDDGKSVCMIADISKSTARQAGLGVILLAKISGKPIIAAAYATSRRHVMEKTWDKTTISLPFGRAASLGAEPLFVPADADDATLEACRQELTRRLNDVNARAVTMVDKRP